MAYKLRHEKTGKERIVEEREKLPAPNSPWKIVGRTDTKPADKAAPAPQPAPVLTKAPAATQDKDDK